MVRLSLFLVGGAAAANLLRGTARRDGDDTVATLQEGRSTAEMKVATEGHEDSVIPAVDTEDMAEFPTPSMPDINEILKKIGLPVNLSEEQKKQMEKMKQDLPLIFERLQQTMKRIDAAAAKCPMKSDKDCSEDDMKCVMDTMMQHWQCLTSTMSDGDLSEEQKKQMEKMTQDLPLVIKEIEQAVAECPLKSDNVCSKDDMKCVMDTMMAHLQCMASIKSDGGISEEQKNHLQKMTTNLREVFEKVYNTEPSQAIETQTKN